MELELAGQTSESLVVVEVVGKSMEFQILGLRRK